MYSFLNKHSNNFNHSWWWFCTPTFSILPVHLLCVLSTCILCWCRISIHMQCYITLILSNSTVLLLQYTGSPIAMDRTRSCRPSFIPHFSSTPASIFSEDSFMNSTALTVDVQVSYNVIPSIVKCSQNKEICGVCHSQWSRFHPDIFTRGANYSFANLNGDGLSCLVTQSATVARGPRASPRELMKNWFSEVHSEPYWSCSYNMEQKF